MNLYRQGLQTMKLMWALAHYDNIDDIKKYIENAYFADRSY